MELNCDLCGSILTETDRDHAVCSYCGMEYGPDRLRELRAEKTSTPTPVPPAPKESTEVSKTKPKQNSGCGVWTLLLILVLDLLVGTHGIVAAVCLIVLLIMIRCSKKK